MKKTTFFITACTFLAACESTPQFQVTGCIEGAQDSILFLEANTLNGIQKVDSIRLGADGKFTFSADAPIYTYEGDSLAGKQQKFCPEFYSLRIANKAINFSVDSTETITFKAKYATMSSDYTVDGSENSQKIKEINLLLQKVQKQVVDIEKNQDILPGDMIDSVRNIIKNYKETVKQKYIFVAPAQAYAYYAVCQSFTDLQGTFQLFNPLTDRTDIRCYATVATSWDYNYPDAPRTQQICNMAIKGMENTATPKEQIVEVDDSKVSETGIINVSLPDINSNIKSLSDLKGKVVMLDFTLYGAKESAERTRILRDIYNKYHDQGFEIYQVSLDEDIHFWKSSIEYLPWICVHETNGSATRIYGVSDLPTYFIIDRNNEIVGRSGLMKGTLEEQIKKLL